MSMHGAHVVDSFPLPELMIAPGAVISAVWMGLGWNYYTTMATECAHRCSACLTEWH